MDNYGENLPLSPYPAPNLYITWLEIAFVPAFSA